MSDYINTFALYGQIRSDFNRLVDDNKEIFITENDRLIFNAKVLDSIYLTLLDRAMREQSNGQMDRDFNSPNG